MTARLVAGLDLGSTGIKILVADTDGNEVLVEQAPTPWRSGPGGTAELDSDVLLHTVTDILTAASNRLDAMPSGTVEAIAVSGMGETGMLINDSGSAVVPAIAWYDPRGAEQVAAFPRAISAEFSGRTGLPLGAQVTAAKLAYLRDSGLILSGLRWLNLPEFVVSRLGGRIALEASLTSRTGLIDQDTGEPWLPMLSYLGVGADFLPVMVEAGADFGSGGDWLPKNFAGARLTIAGHDHLVAAEAEGRIDPEHYHVSMGTAEVLLRVIDSPLDFAARIRLADKLINVVRHVAPGKHVLVAGVKSGLLMRRALQSFGIFDRPGRDRLDAQVMALPYSGVLTNDTIEVTGARNDDGVLAIKIRSDGVTPAEIFGAVLRHSNDEIRALIAAMDKEVPAATGAVLTGGWTGMESVMRARTQVLPQLKVSKREQETAYGAARQAARLLASTASL